MSEGWDFIICRTHSPHEPNSWDHTEFPHQGFSVNYENLTTHVNHSSRRHWRYLPSTAVSPHESRRPGSLSSPSDLTRLDPILTPSTSLPSVGGPVRRWSRPCPSPSPCSHLDHRATPPGQYPASETRPSSSVRPGFLTLCSVWHPTHYDTTYVSKSFHKLPRPVLPRLFPVRLPSSWVGPLPFSPPLHGTFDLPRNG